MNVKFRIGSVLAAGFRTWFKNFLPFMLLAALVHTPLMFWATRIAQDEVTPEAMMRFTLFLGAGIWLMLPLNILLSGLLIYGVLMELQGQRASFGACIRKGLARFFPSLGTTISVCLCIGGVMFCGGIPFAYVGRTIMLIVVGVTMLYFVSMLYVSTPASALERSGMAAALARSHALTRGHKLAIASLFILLVLIHFALLVLVSTAMAVSRELPGHGLFTFCVYATLGVGVIVGSIGAVMAGVAYYFLRAEKDGTSPAELAAVFD